MSVKLSHGGLVSKFVAIASVVSLAACGNRPTVQSQVDAVDIVNSDVKWQSIGNCWAYAALGWAESLVMKSGKSMPNYSESYQSYTHFREQLTGRTRPPKEIQTGGSFEYSSRLMLRYGLLAEGDFIPAESTLTKSAMQLSAKNYINESLKSGLLSKDLSAATVQSELDIAFGVVGSDYKSKIVMPSQIELGVKADGTKKTLESEINSWQSVDFPADYEGLPSDNIVYWDQSISASRAAILNRVKLALNAGHPVVMDWFVEFNALDTSGVFSHERLLAKNVPGKQGYHSTVLEDYNAEGVNPADGKKFVVADGVVSKELQDLAARYGKITAFIVKNSWGGAERLDRSSYSVAGVKGFHKLTANYLFGWLPQTNEDTQAVIGIEAPLNGFHLPPGF